jgi:cell pole-organizing protein PopZ
MNQPAKLQEPSMEEILASIRRIIADDDAKPPPPEPAYAPTQSASAAPLRTPPASPPLPAPRPEPPASPPLAATGFQTINGRPDVVFEESEPEPEMPGAPRAHLQVGKERPLMSAATSAAVDSAFNTLAHTVLLQNARTLEDLVREMLQPLLKTWLDDNLPGLVERLVRAEIERLSRGRG